MISGNTVTANGAGIGSLVVVRDLERQAEQTYTLMSGPMFDIDAGHVSLASPIGRALKGKSAGDEVVVDAPQRQIRLRIIEVRTSHETTTS